MRLLCAVGEKHIYDEIKVIISCEGYDFTAGGKTEIQKGWREIYDRFKATLKSAEKDEDSELPEVSEGDILSYVESSVTEHHTTPPKAFTEVICYERGIRNRP